MYILQLAEMQHITHIASRQTVANCSKHLLKVYTNYDPWDVQAVLCFANPRNVRQIEDLCPHAPQRFGAPDLTCRASSCWLRVSRSPRIIFYVYRLLQPEVGSNHHLGPKKYVEIAARSIAKLYIYNPHCSWKPVLLETSWPSPLPL